MADLAGKSTINKSKLTQRINLGELLGREPEPEEKQSFVLEALAVIEERTLNGEQVGGGSFAPYSQEYADRKGVSRSSVDLFQDGAMLDSLRPISETKNTVTFGLSGDEAPKAYNHQVGDTLPTRPWFGLTTDEAVDIAVRIDMGIETDTEEDLSPSAVRFLIEDLLSEI